MRVFDDDNVLFTAHVMAFFLHFIEHVLYAFVCYLFLWFLAFIVTAVSFFISLRA